MSKWILVLVAGVAISIPSLAQYKAKNNEKSNTGSSAEQQVKQIDNQYRESAIKSDANFAEKHVADNFMGVNANGQLTTKAQLVQERKAGKFKYDAIELKSTKIQMYDNNTAVVDHEAHVKATGPNGPIDGDYRATLVWVKQGNNWKLVSFQSTPVQGSMAAANK